jgi:hypothetical protein
MPRLKVTTVRELRPRLRPRLTCYNEINSVDCTYYQYYSGRKLFATGAEYICFVSYRNLLDAHGHV